MLFKKHRLRTDLNPNFGKQLSTTMLRSGAYQKRLLEKDNQTASIITLLASDFFQKPINLINLIWDLVKILIKTRPANFEI